MSCSPTCRTPTTSQAHCPTCHKTFGGVTGFDAHRRNGACLDPTPKGYRNVGGVWRLPGPDPTIRDLSWRVRPDVEADHG